MRSTTPKKTSSTLVGNTAAASSTPARAIFTFNARTKLVRNETLEGRPYKVVPMVMLTEGVHSGTNGPLYYPREELAKTPAVWNHKPVVVYHPTINGNGVSACDPEIIETYKVGIIMNTKFDKLGRLSAEAWIEEDRANKVDVRIMEAVNAGTMLELSTGVFTDNTEEAGEWEGEKYTAIARNYRPDHLAILPDKKGACSIADGAGFIRNEAAAKLPSATVAFLDAAVRETLRSVGIVDITSNELSLDSARDQLWGLLNKKLNPTGTMMPGCDAWIRDVYSTFFIYSHQTKLFRQGFTKTDTKVELEGEPSEVVRVTEYRTTDGAFVGNHSTAAQPKISMNKTEIINGLIANAASGWKETDREFLTGLTDERLQIVANKATPVAAPAPAAPAVAPVATAQPALNEQEREALSYGQRKLTEDKNRLIGVITANKANTFTAAVLNTKGIAELEGIAALAAAPAAPAANVEAPRPFFGGQAPTAPVANADTDEVLSAPSMTFGK